MIAALESAPGATDWGSAAGVGAIVLGGEFLGLGIVRSLGRRGVPVVVVDDEPSIAGSSRYASRRIRVPNLREPEAILAVLRDLALDPDLRGWALFPTRDEMVATIAANKKLFAGHFRLTTPDWESVHWAWDKRNTYRLAEELGVPAPKTWYPEGPGDLEAIPGAGPFVLKPAIKEHFFYATKSKAWRADDRSELRRLFEEASAIAGHGEIMVQELIPGTGSQQFSFCAFVKEGEAIGSMVVNRHRQHPPEFGRASTYVETIDDIGLERPSMALLRATGHYGLVEVEYKLDPRDGVCKLLDINARAWGYHSIGQAAGVDFPYLVFADLIGEPVEPSRARTGVHWIRLLTDIPTALVELMGRTLGFGVYLTSLRRTNTEAVFARDDLRPFLVEAVLAPYMALRKGF